MCFDAGSKGCLDSVSSLFIIQKGQNVMEEATSEATLDEVIQWVTFRLDGENYGIRVMLVQEILRVTEIVPVPGAPGYVLGIVNLRGNVVTVIDTRSKFGLPPEDLTDATRIVIIESNNLTIGMLVDSVSEVVEFNASEIELAPHMGNEDSSKYIQGVTNRNDELLILIDLECFLSDDELNEMGID